MKAFFVLVLLQVTIGYAVLHRNAWKREQDIPEKYLGDKLPAAPIEKI